ncbi:MAG: esterase-like activity of phytase family protein, partial [Candidatus Competibacterales bacterium]|nr:esterase-like activity of phytase family protein [Candidatus Competibacterales bacterium]
MPVAGFKTWEALLSGIWLTACAWAATPIDPAPAGATELTVAGALRLPRTEIDGLALAGLSALAWDADEQRLYAVSDFGRLFHLRPVFDGDRLVDAELLAGFPLTDARGRALRPPWTDAEGLTLRHGTNGIRGDSELLISYERRPRIRRYTPEGRRLDGLALPPPLADVNAYADPNQALEA